MLFDWGGNNDIDVVNVMKPNAISSNMWTGGCGSNSACTSWQWMSYDFDGDGINGTGMVDGPFAGMNANFNLGAGTVDLCCDAATRCNDSNACTADSCDSATGACVNTTISCNDSNACTADSCDPATGCVNTAISTDDGNACTADSCDPATGVVHTVISCNDNNACTADSCNPATGCVNAVISCNDNNACTTDTCSPATGCVNTAISCNDNNACTADSCDPATGCVNATISCNDNNLCTTDSCDPATGCVYTPAVVCDDNNLCTNDSCDPATGACAFAPKCAASETCDPAVGTCNPGCPAGSVKSVVIRGGGQNPGSVDLQIQTSFTVIGGGCIVGSTASSVSVTPGTVLEFNCKMGTGPHPTSGTWKGVPLTTDSTHQIVCPTATGDVGKLILDNKSAGGSDTDRMTVKVQ